jgi:hypothetical protein
VLVWKLVWVFFVGIIRTMEITQTLEKQAEQTARELAGNTPIRPRRHAVRYNVNTGRARYPFKAMILGDFFLLDSQDHAVAARNALKTFYRRYAGRKFTIKQEDATGYWICRRAI